MLTARQIRRRALLRPSVSVPVINHHHHAASTVIPAAMSTVTSPPIASTSYRRTHPQFSPFDVKGKGRAYDWDVACQPGLTKHTSYGRPSRRRPALNAVFYRSFHATARRDAIPLIPAGLVILKGTSILTLATAFSRILISFFPVGTLAAFKMARMGKWITEVAKPSVSPEVEDFWRMWCEDEKPIVLTKEESDKLLDREPDDNGWVTLEDGRIAYSVPMPPSRWSRENLVRDQITPQAILTHHSGNRRRAAHFARRMYFCVPDLPPLSVPYYDRLDPTRRQQVDAYRRYWIGLRRFKDCFKTGRWIVGLIFMLPVYLLAGVYLAGLERVPLTGRWRLILLTPEEEDTISTSLAGVNWFRSVVNLLTTAERPAPAIVPPDDWRWTWVQGVLTRLERAVVADCQSRAAGRQPANSDSLYPVPPMPYHPLKPRPRASSLLHGVLPGGDASTGREHLEIGPPYNLMLMEKDEKNAFSYGFGGHKAGGIVVYSGLLDSILRTGFTEELIQQPAPRGVFSSLFSTSPSPSRPRAQPTEEQTLHLACVLAHEMGHLLLSHHLETLSQQQVLWPSVLGLTMDLVRAFIWPFTTEELIGRFGEIGFQWKHEYEADLAGLRLLAVAGFNPRAAVDHFSSSVADLREIQPVEKEETGLTGTFFKLWTKATHPSPEKRTDAIREELNRWELEARKADK
ncbi:hypothetical protein IAR55_001789 [Kwoniella newhampshirensis]|uniref:Peptidase M48 domain-containing protein n=1 Tax=Kwoniella newhampshirensis TaxID=1651941 RepID=A0AAW0Z3E2_9TREE